MPDEPIVQIEAITHQYGQRVALDAVTFGVDRGSIFGLLGPNGGGKTTLFKILTTLMAPTGGSARIGGADVATQSRVVRRQIGVVFQSPSLDDNFTVLENLRQQGNLYGLRGSELDERIRGLLDRFDLADRARDRVKTLSGGLKRRVELVKALLHAPKVLILDEPSTGLDPAARLSLMEHLQQLRDRDGVTSLLTTHLMEEADRCDRIGILDEGKLVALDSPNTLKATIGGDIVTVSTHDPAELAAHVKERFHITSDLVNGQVQIARDRGHEFVPELIEAFPGEIESVTVGKPTLEDVFVQLTGHRLTEPTKPGGT